MIRIARYPGSDHGVPDELDDLQLNEMDLPEHASFSERLLDRRARTGRP